MKQHLVFRVLMGIGGMCGVICGMIIVIHALIGFLPPVVAHPWFVVTIGSWAAVGGFCLATEKFYGRPL